MERLFKYPASQSLTVEKKKSAQKKHILRSIYFSGPLSNSELAKQIKLSTPKINSLLLELIDEGLVQELGRGDSSGGRRPNIYGLVEDGFYVVGITINTARTVICIYNSCNARVEGPHYFSIKIQPSKPEIFDQVNNKLEKVVANSPVLRDKILAIGIELPGLINLKEGSNKTYFPEIGNLSTMLQKIFGLPVFFNHDAKLRLFAEQHFGLAKNKKNVLLLQADWGLGLGIIVNSKLYSGKSGFSGEFGHIPLVNDGPLCVCGKQGCLETVVSAIAIAKQAREALESGQSSLIRELVKNDLGQIDISVVIGAANAGDQFAISLFSEVGKWLGKGMAFLIQLFNPELIIISGQVALANQFIIAPIQQAIQTYSNRDISNDTEILFSELGTKAGTMGAAAYALEQSSK